MNNNDSNDKDNNDDIDNDKEENSKWFIIRIKQLLLLLKRWHTRKLGQGIGDMNMPSWKKMAEGWGDRNMRSRDFGVTEMTRHECTNRWLILVLFWSQFHQLLLWWVIYYFSTTFSWK